MRPPTPHAFAYPKVVPITTRPADGAAAPAARPAGPPAPAATPRAA
jgi:hypothetical protein